MFATLIILPSASATQTNLLLNSSFEDGTYVDETSTPDNWWKGGSGWQAWKNTGGPYEGTKMVCVGSTSDSWSYFGQDVLNISAGKTYTFSAYVKTEDWGSPVGRLQVEFKDSNNSLIRADSLDVVSGINTTWAQYTLITGAAPSGTTRANFMVWGKNGSPLFDNLSARALNNTFYVRSDGNDANSGTANTSQGAWATIQHAADTADPSDTVEVEPGTYNEQVVITHSGLANQLMIFHADGEVIIDGQDTRAYGIKLDGASYIKIQGFTIRNAGSIGIFLVNNSNHNVLLNNTCYSNGSTATSALGDRPCGIYLYTSSNYNTVEGNLCRNNTSSGIWLEGSSSYCTVNNNKSYSNGYGGIIVAGATDYNTVSYNLIYSNGQLGMDVSWGAHDNTISNNTIYNNGATGISSNNYGGPNYIKNNIIVTNGLNYSWAYGITMDSNSTAVLSYNDVYNNGQGGTKNYLGILPGPGDICLDPLFKSINPESADFLKLQSLDNSDSSESPCIDAGSPSDLPSTNSGHRIDIGTYDLYSHAPIQGGLVGEYFDNTDFTALKVTRIDPRVYFDWGSSVPDCSLAPETFSIRWQGQVKIDLAQDYTFYTSTDDGGRLWIDNQLIIDSWVVQAETEHSATVSLTTGLHDIKYEYYQDTGWAIAKLSWSAPSINKTIIPADHLYYFGRSPQGQYIQGGLKGVYGKYTNLSGNCSYVLIRIDPQINFDWGYNMADYGLGWDNYTAKWKGKVRIDTADTYTFYTTADDGVRLWVNNQVLVDDWQYQYATENSGSIYLAPGLYDIELDYFEGTGSAVCKLLWSSTAITKSVIPSTNLYYKNEDSSDGGLLAEYYSGTSLTLANLKIRRIDPNIDFDWITFYPDNVLGGSNYSIRWTGQVKADFDETYTLYANSDDGLKLWVDNNLLISTWYGHGVFETSSTINLTAGWHDIKVEYYQDTGYASVKLAYSSPSTPKTVIPQDHLRTTLSAGEASLNLQCSLNSSAAVQTPARTGHSGSIVQTGTGTVNFVPAKFSDGVYLSGSDSSNMGLVQFSSSDLNKKEGEIEFWFKPAWNSDDSVWHHLFSTNWTWDSCIEIFKHSDNFLYFKIVKDGVQHGIVADMTGKWTANTWHHLAASYGPAGMKFYLDYQQLPVSWTFNGEPAYAGTLPDTFASDIYIGGGGEGGVPSNAIFDELKIYNQQIVPSDTTAPIIAITSHQDNQTVNSSPVTVSGTIDDNLASVTINTVQATVSEGTFTGSVPLSLGSNAITVSAADQSNNNSTTSINLVFSDITPPTTPTVTDDGTYTISNAQLHASWTACSDPESGINRYEYAIGTTSGGTDVVNWTSAGLNTEVTKTGLSLTEGQTYYFSVAAINNASGSSVGYSNGITLDSGAPSGTITINSNAQYTNSTTVTLTLSATESGSGLSQMQFSNDSTNWSTPEAYATTKSWTLTTENGTKTVYAKFEDAAGNWSNAVSNTIILDTTVPVIAITSPANNSVSTTQTITVSGTIDDNQATITVNGTAATVSNGTFTANNITLTQGSNTITATATDLAGNNSSSSITVNYQTNGTLSIAITSPANNIIVSTSTITVLGTVTDNAATVTVNGISATVVDNTFTALSISLTNGNNIVTARAVKDAQVVEDTINVVHDSTAYMGPIVIDDGQYTTSATQLHAYWLSQGSPGSVAVENQYSIGTTPGATDVVGWTSTGTNTEVTQTGLSLTHGQIYYFNVKSKNSAGVWSRINSSDGIIVNAHLPVINSITPQDNSTLLTKATVNISVNAQDDDSDPLEYKFLVDDNIVQDWSSSSIYTWTALPTNTLIRKITCQVRDDKGGQASQDVNYNIQIDTTDTTPPTPPVVTADQYSNSLTKLHASWSSEDQESGISEYRYAIGTAPGATDVVDWTSAGTNTEITSYGLNLTEGQNYYFSVRAINGAGLTSPAGYSLNDTASQTVVLKITSPQNNWLITDNLFPITGIVQGTNLLSINYKTVGTINQDGSFTGPTLVAPGYAKVHNLTDDDSHIIMNYPGPTTITAIAGYQIKVVNVYCYQLFVKNEERISGFSDQMPPVFFLSEIDQRWNYNTLTTCPFSSWANTNNSYRAQIYPYPSGSVSESYSNYSSNGISGEESACATGNYSLKKNLQMTIRTLPTIAGQIEPMFISFERCNFSCNQDPYYNPIVSDPSLYKVNGKTMAMLNGNGSDSSVDNSYITITDYQPDYDLILQVTGMPIYNINSWEYFKGFSFGNIDMLTVSLESPKADNRVQRFTFGKTDIGNPCIDEKAPALVVFYNDVIDSQFNVLAYPVFMYLKGGYSGGRWEKHGGPDSGTFAGSNFFLTPAQGGLYEFDLSAGGKATKTYLLLPLAGADIIDWLDAQTITIGSWVADKKTQTLANCEDLNKIVEIANIDLTWVRISDNFDYVLHPVNSDGAAPCERFWMDNPKNDIYGYITVNGVVVHGSKINNMLWGLFGRYWGYSTQELQLQAQLNQRLRSLSPDPPSSQHAIELAGTIFDNLTTDIRDILTPEELRQLQAPDLNENIHWPCIYKADMGRSSLVRPIVPTAPF